MPFSRYIWVLVLIAAVATLAGIWQFSNARGYRSRGRRRDPLQQRPAIKLNDQNKKRMMDARQLTPHERKLYKEAQNLIENGKVPAASRIFEQLNLPREAIQCLEDHGYIDEAARILIRMQKHHRAGIIYARHAMWDKASQCFKVANMPIEVAKCARQGNHLPEAAFYFEKAGRLEDAAKCFLDCFDFLNAGRKYLQAKNIDAAMAAFSQMSHGASAEQLSFDELKIIISHVSDTSISSGIVSILNSRGKLIETILDLCQRKQKKAALEAYKLASADIGPQLMAEISESNGDSDFLALVFLEASQFLYAGMIFERSKKFAEAAKAFESALQFERAAYCYERLGNELKVQEMKQKAGGLDQGKQQKIPPSPFSLANINSSTVARSDEVREKQGNVTKEIPRQEGFSTSPSKDFSKNKDVQHEVPSPPLHLSQDSFRIANLDSDENTAIVKNLNDKIRKGPVASKSSKSQESSADDAQKVEFSLKDQDKARTSQSVNLPEENRSPFYEVEFLSDLDIEQKERLWNIGFTAKFTKGDTILTYDDEPRGIHIITEGSVLVFRYEEGRDQLIDTIGPSEFFGELWLLADQPTQVRFVAAATTKIRIIGREPFTKLLDKDGTIARKLYKRFTADLISRLLTHEESQRKRAIS